MKKVGYRGEIVARNRGMLKMYFVNNAKEKTASIFRY